MLYNDFSAPLSTATAAAEFLTHILTYLETPPYLRRRLFPLHNNLKHVALLPALEIPSHIRKEAGSLWREGVAVGVDEFAGSGTLVDAGLARLVSVTASVPTGARTTVRFGSEEEGAGRGVSAACATVPGTAVAAEEPRVVGGVYWGYSVRWAGSLAGVFTECPYEGGYDVTVGASERGEDVGGLEGWPRFGHAVVVFGGVGGLEGALEGDAELSGKVGGVEELFDFWVDVCPGKTSRVVRTEEAVWVGLGRLSALVRENGRV